MKDDKRRATLRVDVDAEELATSTLLVVRVPAIDADGDDLELHNGQDPAAESDRRDQARGARAGGRSSNRNRALLARAVLETAINAGRRPRRECAYLGSRRPGVRRANRRPPRADQGLSRGRYSCSGSSYRKPGQSAVVLPRTPHSENRSIPLRCSRAPLVIPAALADRQQKLLSRIVSRSPRDLVEVLSSEEARSQTRGYVQRYRRALDSADEETSSAFLAMDTVTVRVATATEEVHGPLLLPTHPLRLAWVAAHDQLLRGWAEEVSPAGNRPAERFRRIDFAMVSRLSPANMPFITISLDGGPFLYAEELTSAPRCTCRQPSRSRSPPRTSSAGPST